MVAQLIFFFLHFFQGNYKNCNFTCIRFADLVQNGTGGVGKISSGGIGKYFVELELTSQPGKGMIGSIVVNGHCNQSAANGVPSDRNIGWKWNISNSTTTKSTPTTNQDLRSNRTASKSNSSVHDLKPSSSDIALGWGATDSKNMTRPLWVIPSNASVSITPEKGWNKPLNSSYHLERSNGSYPPPLFPNPPRNPAFNEPPSNVPYGWIHNFKSNSSESERDARNIGWRNN